MSSYVNLTLKTTSILADNQPATYFDTTIDNEIGTVSKNRTSITWKNINLKTLLGDLYEKYDLFNINLIYMGGTEVGATTETDNDNRFFQVKLSGLNFISSYNQPTQSNNNIVVIKIAKITNTAGAVWSFDSNNEVPFTFRKQEMANISIDLHTVLTDTYYNLGVDDGLMLGHMIFLFNIVGVEDSKKNDITIQRYDLHNK